MALPESLATPQQASPRPAKFRTFAPGEDPESSEEIIRALSQALVNEGVVLYITRGNTQAASLFWQELIRARFRCSPLAQQVFCLGDFTSAAILHRYPAERSTTWDTFKHGSVLKFMSAVPLSKWKALMVCGQVLERQKQAFFKTHGEFLYLEAIATPPAHQRQGLGSVLLRHICQMADGEGKFVYVEASSEAARGWYGRHGFADVMCYSLRPHAPRLYIMARAPRPQQQQTPEQLQQGQRHQQEQQPPEPAYQSVRQKRLPVQLGSSTAGGA